MFIGLAGAVKVSLVFYGLAILCLDDPGVAAIAPGVQRPTLTYGIGEDADVRAFDIRAEGLRQLFTHPTSHLLPSTWAAAEIWMLRLSTICS